ncbi:MAG: four helix bundle protein [Candidatus Cloacimonetes bacterium]|nr:four helix bundle protein [Candidatus Cloacimonadota bacterium]MBL7086034.1 four helix bundle protein [Candidatus Cloacimonadota bacterium]
MKKKIESFVNLDIYRLAESLGDKIWEIVSKWDRFAKNTLGYQLTKSADSVGANIAEGSGRFHFTERKQFARIARGLLYETSHWLRRAYIRKILKEEEIKKLKKIMDELRPRLNAYINSIGTQSDKANSK